MIRRLVLAFALSSTIASDAAGQSISIWADESCTDVDIWMPPPGPYRIFVMAHGPQDGFTGAEFRIAGLPAGWSVVAQPNPDAAAVLGDPFGGGVNIAFPACQEPICSLLFEVLVYPSTNEEVWLEVRGREPPSNPSWWWWPVFTRCDGPYFTAVRAVGGQICINRNCSEVPVKSTRWSEVKALYRDAGR